MTLSQDQIRKVIEEEINPSLKFHNGSCELVSIDQNVISLKMFGGCSGCPSSIIALFQNVSSTLKEHFPEAKDIILSP